MTVLVTGGTGFIGLTIAESLARDGENVVVYDLNPHPQGFSPASSMEFIQGDARDQSHLSSAMREHGVDAIVLTAAITADRSREIRAAQAVVDVNVGGIAAGLQACAAAGVARALVMSSGAVYGALGRMDGKLDETATPLEPENLYGITKLTSELVAIRLAEVLDIDLSIGRLGTCFGPLERKTGLRDTLSPQWQVAQLAQAGEPIILPRPGRRDWLYSRDAAAAAMALLRSNRRQNSIYNLASGFLWSISDWCEALRGTVPDLQWRFAGDGEAPNVTYYADYDRAPLSIDRLLADTDFAPRFDLQAAFLDFLQPVRV